MLASPVNSSGRRWCSRPRRSRTPISGSISTSGVRASGSSTPSARTRRSSPSTRSTPKRAGVGRSSTVRRRRIPADPSDRRRRGPRRGFCGEPTGSFDVEIASLVRRSTSIFPPEPPGSGSNGHGSFPHLDRLVFVSELGLAAFDGRGRAVAADRDIDEPLLRRWAEALAGDSMFDSWRRFASIPEALGGSGRPRRRGTPGRYAADAKANDGTAVRSGVTPAETPFVRSIVAGASPPSLAAVADRWQAAGMLVLDTWDRHLRRPRARRRSGFLIRHRSGSARP